MFYLTRIISERDNIDSRLRDVAAELKATCSDSDFPLEIAIRKAKSKRSLSQNALYWSWCAQTSSHFTRAGIKMDKESMHDLFRHMFLGYREFTTPKGELIRTLKSTSALNVTEMLYYMEQVDAWCAEKGCLLERPEDSAYETYRQQQENT